MTDDCEKELRKLKKEKKLNDDFMMKLLTEKTDDNFKLRQKNEELRKEIQQLNDFKDDQKTS